VPDPIAFTTSLWAGIEHAGWTANEDGSVRSAFEERPDYFSSVAFWYQKGVNDGLPEPPYGRARLPFGNATQIAVEDSLADVKTESGKASVQLEVDWAKDLLFFEAQGQGAKMHVPIDIPEAGRYELVAQIGQAPDYGDYVALLDGQQTNLDTRQAATSEIPFPGPEVFHNYLPEVYVAKDRPIGMFNLTKGRHILTFVCMGKDPHSAGYNFGIQEVVLERIPPDEQPAAPASDAKSPAVAAGSVVYRGKPLSYYITQLKNSSAEDRAGALRAIGNFGPDAATAATLLTRALSDESPEVRAAAAGALAQVGSPAAAAVPVLAKLLADSTPRVRSVAAVALKDMRAASVPALPQLLAALDDPVDYVRAAVADAIGAIGPAARTAVPALIKRLAAQHDSNFVFDSVIYALGDIGPDAAAAIPALKEMARRPRLAYPAQEAILQIEAKPVPTYH
jgi:HEAT repeat protein